MEPVTHFLTGACLARTGFNRKTAYATLAMTLAAEAPDLDILAGVKSKAFGFAHHRGFTHSFLGLLIVAAFIVAAIFLFHEGAKRKKPPALPPRWGLLFVFAYIAGLTHILLDYTNNYGVRPFWPFNEKWYSWDIVFIVEPVMLLFLALGLIAPLFARLLDSEFGVKRKLPRGRLAASLALFGVVLMWALRDYEHRRAVNELAARTYQSTTANRVAAGPHWLDPFDWRGIVETDSFYAVMDVNTYQSEVDPQDVMQVYYKPEESEASRAAKASYVGQTYLDWAQFPLIETEHTGDGDYEVRFKDLRYYEPGSSRANLLTPTVVLDKNFHVLWQGHGDESYK